jgi:hypothetical protein
MGFQLVIAEGTEAGREFQFDQASVLIGRTDECDVLLYDSGVSRKHARVFSEGEVFFVEDMGSSNGTRVNSEAVKGKRELKDGDRVELGPVIFVFSRATLATEATELPLDEGGAHTRIVSISELQKSRNKGVALLPKNVGREQVQQMRARPTMELPACRPQPSNPRLPAALRKSDPSMRAQPRRSDPELRAMPRPSAPLVVEEFPAGPPAPLPEPRPSLAPGGRGLAASEKARIRRESPGPLAPARIWWAEASAAKRNAVLAGAGTLGLLLVAGVAVALWPKDVVARVEPRALSAEPVKDSFGHGAGVTFERADQKSFDFEVKSPVQVMVVLHYQAKDISTNEVAINVNGTDLGFVKPDTLNSTEAQLELLVPATLIKRNAPNQVTFDNVKNPPEEESWRVWNLWIETAVLPEKDEQGLLADALENIKRGGLKFDQRDIGATNRWEAYKAYREAWLFYEALPPDRRPPQYLVARDRMRTVRLELDDVCNKLLLEARTDFNTKQYDAASKVLDHVADFFPSRQHPCPQRADAERASFNEE